MTPLLIATIVIGTLLICGVLLLITASEERSEVEPFPAPEQLPGELSDSALGYQDGYQWAKAGHLGYECHGDYWDKDRLYWVNFHQGYRAFRREESETP